MKNLNEVVVFSDVAKNFKKMSAGGLADGHLQNDNTFFVLCKFLP